MSWRGYLECSGLLSTDELIVNSIIAGDTQNIKSPINITLLCLAVLLGPAYYLWAKRQAAHNKPVLIPNSIWKNASFTATCVALFLVSVTLNAGEYFFSLL
jgi:hypothetical protein